jgi:hypothetical protein
MLATVLALALGQSAPLENLDFSRGDLSGWEGSGFYLTAGSPLGPRGSFGACSSDAGSPQRTGMLRYAFSVPNNASVLRFQAFAATRPGFNADSRLDVVLAGVDGRAVPKNVRASSGWTSAVRLLPRWQGKARDYSWDVGAYAGETMQVVLIDRDDRPGHYLHAANFRFEATHQFHDRDFADFMAELQAKHNLPPVARYDSRRFTAISNASETFTVERLRNCELFHDQFLDHFRARGFAVHPPRQRLMIAIFDQPSGFEAYIGQKMPSSIAGVYHTPTNRLVLYDLNENRAFLANKQKALMQGAKLPSLLDQRRFLSRIERQAADASADANLSTTMHECAHLISFNCGLLNRHADGPTWLIEGMANYCESTINGDWVTLGAPNLLRIRDLARARGSYVPLEELIRDNAWRLDQRVMLGYAQSWALFHLLMEKEPARLEHYLELVNGSRAPDYRLQHFREAFGDIAEMEGRLTQAMDQWVKKHPPERLR